MKSKFISLRNFLDKSFKAHPGFISYEATKIPLIANDPLYEISVYKSHKNLREEKSNIMHHKYIFDNKDTLAKTNFQTQRDSTTIVNSQSISQNRRVIIKKIEKDNWLELHESGMLKSSIKMDDLGTLCQNASFVRKSVVWSKDESRFLFVTEKKVKSEDFFAEKEEDAIKALDNFNYKHNFGETCTDFYDLQINVVEFTSDPIELKYVKDIPRNIIPIHPTFQDSEGNSIVFGGYEVEENDYVMGNRFCLNRKTGIWLAENVVLTPTKPPKDEKEKKNFEKKDEEKIQESVEKKDELQDQPSNTFKKINEGQVCYWPLVSPDNKKIAYFYNDELLNIHAYEFGLRLYDLNNETTSTIISTEQNDLEEYCWTFPHELSSACWLDDNTIIFNKTKNALIFPSLIDVSQKKLCNIKLNDTIGYKTGVVEFLGALDANKSLWLLNINNFGAPSRLAILKNGKDMVYNESKPELILENLDHLNNPELVDVTISKENFEEREIWHNGIQGFLWGYKDGFLQNSPQEDHELIKTNRPVLVNLHGGPHAYSTGNFSHSLNMLLRLNWQILTVNFSGSWSFTKDFVRNCTGKIGEKDTKEVVNFIDHIAEEGLISKENMYFRGGSYSGYQGFEFLQRYPKLFKKLFIYNPVTNLIHMAYQTDIPDWVYGEALVETKDGVPSLPFFDVARDYTTEDFIKMIELSPALRNFDTEVLKKNNVKVLQHLGDSDLRCPHQCSLYLFKKLKKQGLDIELMLYKGEGHALCINFKSEITSVLKDLYEMNSE